MHVSILPGGKLEKSARSVKVSVGPRRRRMKGRAECLTRNVGRLGSLCQPPLRVPEQTAASVQTGRRVLRACFRATFRLPGPVPLRWAVVFAGKPPLRADNASHRQDAICCRMSGSGAKHGWQLPPRRGAARRRSGTLTRCIFTL